MQYMSPPFGPSLKASIASSKVISSLISTSYSNEGESFAGSKLNVAIGLEGKRLWSGFDRVSVGALVPSSCFQKLLGCKAIRRFTTPRWTNNNLAKNHVCDSAACGVPRTTGCRICIYEVTIFLELPCGRSLVSPKVQGKAWAR